VYKTPDLLSNFEKTIVVLKHEELLWRTVLTCQQYEPVTNSYRKRVLVRGVLAGVE
jgi:hypothetical protein